MQFEGGCTVQLRNELDSALQYNITRIQYPLPRALQERQKKNMEGSGGARLVTMTGVVQYIYSYFCLTGSDMEA